MKKFAAILSAALMLFAVSCTAEKSLPDNRSCEEIVAELQSVGEKPEYEKYYQKSQNNLDNLSMSLWADGVFEECAEFMQLLHKLSMLVQNDGGSDTVSPGNRRYCDRAKAYITENINRKITVSEVAEAAGVSKNYLTNVFSNSEGIPLMEYINRNKLSYMLELIRRYGYSLSEAGEHVGFSDVNYISRIFKRYYGMTVTEYKRSLEKKDEAL
jgi:AraC-like DNA-binding protein